MFEGLKKRLYKHSFPIDNVKKLVREIEGKSKEEKLALYHSETRKLIEVRHFLSKIFLVMENNFDVQIQGEYPDVKTQVKEYLAGKNVDASFFKDNFHTKQTLFPFYKILKFHSQKNMEEAGIMFDFIQNLQDTGAVDSKKEVLNQKIFKEKYRISKEKTQAFDTEEDIETNMNILSSFRIFNYHDVFPPTNKVLYKFIFNFLSRNSMFFKNSSSVLDIGAGSGILPILYHKAIRNPKTSYYLVDKKQGAIKNSILNCQINDIQIQTAVADLLGDRKAIFPNTSFDFIICNPPWVVAKMIGEDDVGNYDEKGAFIRSVFDFVSERLSQRGQFMLVYSNFSESIGLVEEDFIKKLADGHKLVLRQMEEEEGVLIYNKIKTPVDVLKALSKYQIYLFSRN